LSLFLNSNASPLIQHSKAAYFD